MTDDRDAAALAERLLQIHSWDLYTAKSEARDILGEHGRFLPDGRKAVIIPTNIWPWPGQTRLPSPVSP